MKIYIKKELNYSNPILYVLKIVEQNLHCNFDFVDSQFDADIIWDHTNPDSQIIALKFYSEIKKSTPELSHETIFKKEQFILDEKGNKDLIATIFYMLNCLQEYLPGTNDLDYFGRFKYEATYQYKYNSIETNLAQQYIDQLANQLDIKGSSEKSAFFISHDIDSMYGSFLQDGLWALKRMRIDVILTIIFNEMIRKPHWRNIDKIIKINSEYDIRSTFFWLVNKGSGELNIKNADYSIRKEQKLLNMAEYHGFVNGLHKSCTKQNFNDEIKKGNLNTTFNRYHFLKFLPHKDWRRISDSVITFDASLGFAERYGFRNSYGKAFQPYNFSENKPYNFVEAPLNFMDGTFHKYMKIDPDKTGDTIIDFFEKNKQNCLFSLLWHNTYFTEFKYNPFLKEYKKIIAYLYENQVNFMTPQDIVNKYQMAW